MDTIVYRPIQESELPLFYLRRWEFKVEEDPTIDIITKDQFLIQCLAYLKEPFLQHQFYHFGAFAKDDMVAIASVVKVPMVPHLQRIQDAYGYVTNVYTIPSARNKGIGRELMDAIKVWAVKENLELLLVWPSDASVPFYQRLGFEAKNQPLILGLRDV